MLEINVRETLSNFAKLLSRFSRVRLCVTPQTAAHQGYPRPWDSPGKNTGVGCHFLLQCMKVKSESEVAQSCPTLCDPMDCSLPGFSVHGIFQARVGVIFKRSTSKVYYRIQRCLDSHAMGVYILHSFGPLADLCQEPTTDNLLVNCLSRATISYL